MRTRQNIKLQLKMRLNVSLTVTTLNSPVESRHSYFLVFVVYMKKKCFSLILHSEMATSKEVLAEAEESLQGKVTIKLAE